MDDFTQTAPAVGALLKTLFTMFLISGIACEIYGLFATVFQFTMARSPRWIQKWITPVLSFSNRLAKIVRDFRSRVYYKPFWRQEPVIIRSPDAMQELSEAPELSQRAVYADIFGFKHTLSHTEINFDPNEQINLRYRLFARAIRVNGLSQIKALHPYLEARCRKTVQERIDPETAAGGSKYPPKTVNRILIASADWKSIQIAPIMRDFATGMLGVYFFGEKLCEEPEFSHAMSRYYDDTVAYMGALQIVPVLLQPFAHSIITNKGRALKVLFERLHRAANSKQDEWKEEKALKSMTLFDNMIVASAESNYWTHTAVIQAIIGIWFAASHQPWINLHFVFLELCARPEYAEMIHQEVQSMESLDYEGISRLPILDSFIKEAVRVNPLDKMSIRRKALKPFTFSNGGPHVSVGEIACVPGWEIMHDESKYVNADTFDGLRFVKTTHSTASGPPDSMLRGTTFTDASKDFPIWGLGSKVCPGRWHSALVIKMALIQLVKAYEFRLADDPSSYKWFWESFQMPYESSKVLIRKRECCKGTTS